MGENLTRSSPVLLRCLARNTTMLKLVLLSVTVAVTVFGLTVGQVPSSSTKASFVDSATVTDNSFSTGHWGPPPDSPGEGEDDDEDEGDEDEVDGDDGDNDDGDDEDEDDGDEDEDDDDDDGD